MSDPRFEQGLRHCDQCFCWYPKDLEGACLFSENKVVLNKPHQFITSLCSRECSDKWKAGVPPELRHP